MMKMHDSLVDAVADVSADLPALVTSARKQGMGLRRRRRALASVGATAALAAVAVGGYAVTTAVYGGNAPDPTFAVSSTGGPTAPLTGRMVAAALASSVDEVADGRFSEFRGDDARHLGGEPMGELLFAPSSGGAPGLVQVELQRLSSYGLAKRYRCGAAYMHDCHLERLSNGDTLRTYTDQSSGSARGYRRYVAEVLSPRRDLRLVVSAANTQQDEKHAVRTDPVLSPAQLRTVALESWWSRTRLPSEFVAAGRQLPSYSGLASPAG